MRNKSKLKIIITIFGIIFAFLTISNLNLVDNSFNNDGTAENQDESHSRNPKISGYWTTNFIHVDGNWSDTATVYDWCSGDGSWGNPYTIENVIIDASSSPTGSGILINNSKNEYFIIRNCTVYNAFAGIWLENTDNGTLTLNNCTSNSRGIRLRNNCKNNIIANNMADGNSLVGIILEFNCDNNNISGNSANGPIQIRGIRLRDYCDNNIISGNSVNDNDLYGIYLNYYCDDNTISGNTANGNNRGIFLTDRCDGNTISGNNANENNYFGIYLWDDCDGNTISGNTANENNLHGIFLCEYCDNNAISGNTANDNGDRGIYLSMNCTNTNISGNTANENENYGIYFELYCGDNVIFDNIICHNDIYGVYLTFLCDGNNFSLNCFIGNGDNARNEGSANLWDNGASGNYWDDYSGPDIDNNGIGDLPYYIGPKGIDTKPLIYAMWDLDGDSFSHSVELELGTDPWDPLWYPMPNLRVSHFSSVKAYMNTSFVLDFSISNNGIWKAEGVIVIVRCEELDLTLFNNTNSPFNIDVDDTEYISIGYLPLEITGDFTLSLIVDPGNLINEVYSLKNGSLRIDWELDNSMQALLSIIPMRDNGDSDGGNGMDPVLIFSLGSIAGVAFGVILTLGVIRLRKRRKSV